MRRFMILAAILVIGSSYLLLTGNDEFTPFTEMLSRHINTATLHTCEDTAFGTAIRVPSGFIQEADTADIAWSYKRYAYYPPASCIDADGEVIIEYLADFCDDDEKWTERIDSISRSDNYAVFSKSIRLQKIMFTYQVTYPLAYDTCIERIKQEIRDWTAIATPVPKILPIMYPRKRKAQVYHSGFSCPEDPIETPFLFRK